MERYVTQLIEDLHHVTSKMKPPMTCWEEAEANQDNDFDIEDMSYVDDYLYGDRYPLSTITRIASEQLPPAEKLTIEQQALLSVELEDFLKYFHFYLDFPQGYPNYLRYPFIRNIWEEDHVPMMIGRTHIEFCDYDEEKCIFPGYCKVCDDVREMEKSMQDINNVSNDNMEELDLFGENNDNPYIEDMGDLHD